MSIAYFKAMYGWRNEPKTKLLSPPCMVITIFAAAELISAVADIIFVATKIILINTPDGTARNHPAVVQ